jgi:gliding motility-associated-like protein
MRRTHIILIWLVLITKISFGQSIVDSCFTSVSPSTDFISSVDLANMGIIEADIVEWTGASWTGGWPAANLTIPPPTNMIGCRAIFIGNATTWTSGGEGFGLRLNTSLIAGQTYSFNFNYVSDGFGSNGIFSPSIYTNSSPGLGYFVGNLPAVGYSWTMNTFSFTATSAQAGHKWIIITTAPSGSSGLINSFCNTCNDTSIVNCSVNLGKDTTLCQGETITLDATTPNAAYLWQDSSSNPTFNVTEQGTYWVQVTVNNCSSTDTINVGYNLLPTIDLGNDTSLCQGETLTLNATTPNATYLWQDNSSNSTFNVTQQGTYWVQATVNCGTNSDTIIIELENCDCYLYIPNAFTPNSDNINDNFSPLSNCDFSEYTLMIFNRWGEKIFETNTHEDSWNGTYRGKISQIGVYVYLVIYRFKGKDMTKRKKYGNVTLVR